MSHTGRAVYAMTYEPENLTPTQRTFIARQINDDSQPSVCPADAPTDAEHREHREGRTLSAAEWSRFSRN